MIFTFILQLSTQYHEVGYFVCCMLFWIQKSHTKCAAWVVDDIFSTWKTFSLQALSLRYCIVYQKKFNCDVGETHLLRNVWLEVEVYSP